jgi:2'-5' RNA ligase
MTEHVKSTVFVSLDETAVGEYANKLPLHITVIPPFEHDNDQTIYIENIVSAQLELIEPFSITGREEDDFGSDHVRLVGSEVLRTVHLQLLPLIKSIEGVNINVDFAGDNYNPHSTFIGNRGLAAGERRRITSLYMGQRRPSETEKIWHVVEEFKLGNS